MQISHLSVSTPSSAALGQLRVPKIESVSSMIHRPLWSVMIPTYNGTQYLEHTLRSVLEQDAGADQMQIEVIDDCSTADDPERLVKEVGQGRISFVRNFHNQGLIGNWNVCIQRARGHWVHILHQDDLVLPGFYKHMQAATHSNLDVGAAFCRYVHIDENHCRRWISSLEREAAGVLDNWMKRIATVQLIQFPAMVVKRSVYEELGGFCAEAYYAADWEMWKRIAVYYRVWYEPEILACYRQHSASETSRLVRSGADISDIRKAIEMTKSYLPTECAVELSRQARKHYAFYALNTAQKMIMGGDLIAANTQIKEALRCNLSPGIMRYAIALYKLAMTQYLSKYWRLRHQP